MLSRYLPIRLTRGRRFSVGRPKAGGLNSILLKKRLKALAPLLLPSLVAVLLPSGRDCWPRKGERPWAGRGAPVVVGGGRDTLRKLGMGDDMVCGSVVLPRTTTRHVGRGCSGPPRASRTRAATCLFSIQIIKDK